MLTAAGSTRWGEPVSIAAGATRVTARLPSGPAIGLSAQVVGSLPSHQAVISVGGHGSYELAGSLSDAVVPGPWRLAGTSQGYAVYTFAKPPAPITASTTGGRPLTLKVLSSNTKSEQVSIDAPAASTIIRSVAWDSGWRATVSVNGGPARSVTVNSYHLVQQVRVPAGHDVVTFQYRPPHLLLGTVLSIGGVGVLLVLLGGWFVQRRRRQPTDAEDVPAPDPTPEVVSV
jgi:hypothetical protein